MDSIDDMYHFDERIQRGQQRVAERRIRIEDSE